MKKLVNIINKHLGLVIFIVFILLWQILNQFFNVTSFLIPAPSSIIKAFVSDFSLLLQHSYVTLLQAFLGLLLAIILGYIFALLMDFYPLVEKIIYPIIIISQTIPIIAIAPLLVIFLGYGITSKVVVVFLVCFFPITMSLIKGFKSVNTETLVLMKSMNASKLDVFKHIKFYASLSDFFNGLKLAVTYAIIGSVIAEWLGGEYGLGVYMIRVRKSFAYDKMFAVIFIISILSIFLVYLVSLIQKKAMPWLNKE